MMKTVVGMLLMNHMGPWPDRTPESQRQRDRGISRAVVDAILDVIFDPAAETYTHFDATFHCEKERLIEITFFGRATHTAEQIAKAFKELSGVSVNVMVWECCSEYECDGSE